MRTKIDKIKLNNTIIILINYSIDYVQNQYRNTQMNNTNIKRIICIAKLIYIEVY